MLPSYRNHQCRLAEYTYQGLRLVFLENEFLRVGVLVDKGADIFQFLHKPSDTEFMLHTPRGLRPPAVQSVGSGWGAFLDYYQGGWQEILPNGGPACTYKGVEFGLHGEVTTIPWDYFIGADTPAEVQVTLSVRPFRTPFHLQRTMTLRRGEPLLLIEEALTNEGAEAMDFMWGHHPAFGAPFLGPDCRVDLPAGDLLIETFAGAAGTRLTGGGQYRWPHVSEDGGVRVDFSRPDAPGTGHEDLGYVVNLPEGWYAVTNQATQVGLALTWSLETFPYLWIWRQFNQSNGYPWYGQVYTMALEPWSSYPSAGLITAIENRSAAKIDPGESRHAAIRAVAYQGFDRVSNVSPAGEITGRNDR
ncbi:MAG: aldose 1-epimerase [Chloroflexota bacterium]|nr:aldose 1-epimerase [Chloroflexota bacterium]